jgi:predicted RNA-binding protein with PUA-like domain
VTAFLFKTEPSAYSYADLARDKRTRWDGVSNALALIHLRSVRKGDRIVIYHSGDSRAAVGLAVATSDAYRAPDAADDRHVVVDVRAERAFDQPVPLAVIKADPMFAGFELLRQPRLSVMPVSTVRLARLEKLGRR